MIQTFISHRNWKVYQKCCKHLVEDEIHFLFQCPQYSSIRSKFGIYEKVLALTDILDEEMIKTINPVSTKDLKSILFINSKF
jgi:hypothetical protein